MIARILREFIVYGATLALTGAFHDAVAQVLVEYAQTQSISSGRIRRYWPGCQNGFPSKTSEEQVIHES